MNRNIVISASFTDYSGVKHTVVLDEKKLSNAQEQDLIAASKALEDAKKVVFEKTSAIRDMIHEAVHSK